MFLKGKNRLFLEFVLNTELQYLVNYLVNVFGELNYNAELLITEITKHVTCAILNNFLQALNLSWRDFRTNQFVLSFWTILFCT